MKSRPQGARAKADPEQAPEDGIPTPANRRLTPKETLIRRLSALREILSTSGWSGITPRTTTVDGNLYLWLRKTRTEHRTGRLAPWLATALESIPDWSWEPQFVADRYRQGLKVLKDEIAHNGSKAFSTAVAAGGYHLADWIRHVRQKRRSGKLPDWLAQELEAIPGWSWSPVAQQLDAKVALLEQFVRRHGWAALDQKTRHRGVPLGEWVASARARYRQGSDLSGYLKQRLEAIPGWQWDPQGDLDERVFQILARLAKRPGLDRVKARAVVDGIPIGQWLATRRFMQRHGKLQDDVRARLEALPGWNWERRQDLWSGRIAALRRFVNEQGWAQLTPSTRVDGLPIRRLVYNWRARYHLGRMSARLQRALEAIPGWSWSADRQALHRRLLDEISRFVAEHDWSELARAPAVGGRSLNRFVSQCRLQHRRGEIQAWIADALEAIPGFQWNPVREINRKRLDDLGRSLQDHSIADLPHAGSERAVADWLSQKRRQHRRKTLPPSIRTELEAIPGFSWDPLGDSTRKAIELLRAFVETEGWQNLHEKTVVQGVGIGYFVVYHRRRFARGRMSPQMRQTLEAIPGWTWKRDHWIRDRVRAQALRTYIADRGWTRLREAPRVEGVSLYHWTSTLQARHRRGELPLWLERELEEIPGWIWGKRQHNRRFRLEALRRFLKHHRLTDLRRKSPVQGVDLYGWVHGVRSAHAAGNLRPDGWLARRLEALPGWSWRPIRATRDSLIVEDLRRIVGRRGWGAIRWTTRAQGLRLGDWIRRCRESHQRGTLDPELTKKLESVPGWSWVPPDIPAQRLAALKRFAALYGSLESLHLSTVFEGSPLGRWVFWVRRLHGQGRLPDHLRSAHESIPGWSWDPVGDVQKRRVALVRRFCGRKGFQNIHLDTVFEGHRIGAWVIGLRAQWRQRTISPWVRHALETIPGWTWDPRGARDLRIAKEVRRIVTEHGWQDIRWSTRFEDVNLKDWVDRKRALYRRGRLEPWLVREIERIPDWSWVTRGPVEQRFAHTRKAWRKRS